MAFGAWSAIMRLCGFAKVTRSPWISSLKPASLLEGDGLNLSDLGLCDRFKNVPFRRSPPPGSTSNTQITFSECPAPWVYFANGASAWSWLPVHMSLIVTGLVALSGYKQIMSIPVHNSLKTSHCFRVKTKSLLWPQIPGRMGWHCHSSVSSHMALILALSVLDLRLLGPFCFLPKDLCTHHSGCLDTVFFPFSP